MSWDLGAGLEDRGVIVTGATGGIGQEVARALSSAGARLLLVDREATSLEGLLGSLDGSGHAWLPIDMAGPESAEAIVETAGRRIGAVFGLVNLAAVLERRVEIDDVTPEEWDRQLDVNLKAAFFLSRTAAKAMIGEGQGGRIVLFGSQAWWTGGYGGSVAYAASKGGVVSMARNLARSLGPHRITVNVVAPGQVETSMLRTGLLEDVGTSMTLATPLGYIAQPAEIAGTVVFLASRHANYITGATINLSGGFLMY